VLVNNEYLTRGNQIRVKNLLIQHSYAKLSTNQPSPVVLKRLPLGSLREEFLILGENLFVPGRKGYGWKNHQFWLFVYSTYKKNCTARLVYMGMPSLHNTQEQAALTAVTDVIRVCLVHNCLLQKFAHPEYIASPLHRINPKQLLPSVSACYIMFNAM